MFSHGFNTIYFLTSKDPIGLESRWSRSSEVSRTVAVDAEAEALTLIIINS